MDSRESTERTLLAGTFLFRGAPREAVELARTDPRALRRRAARGEVLYDPRHFQRSLGVVLEGRIQVNKGPPRRGDTRRGEAGRGGAKQGQAR